MLKKVPSNAITRKIKVNLILDTFIELLSKSIKTPNNPQYVSSLVLKPRGNEKNINAIARVSKLTIKDFMSFQNFCMANYLRKNRASNCKSLPEEGSRNPGFTAQISNPASLRKLSKEM